MYEPPLLEPDTSRKVVSSRDRTATSRFESLASQCGFLQPSPHISDLDQKTPESAWCRQSTRCRMIPGRGPSSFAPKLPMPGTSEGTAERQSSTAFVPSARWAEATKGAPVEGTVLFMIVGATTMLAMRKIIIPAGHRALGCLVCECASAAARGGARRGAAAWYLRSCVRVVWGSWPLGESAMALAERSVRDGEEARSGRFAYSVENVR